jgi:hypothetical protein
MNKTIWMCWFQGEDDPKMPPLNRECIKRWRSLNPDWQVNVLSDKTIDQYAPEYFDIVKRCKVERALAAKSDLIRLLLLEKYGGVWADASLYPVTGINVMVKDYLNESNFFAYRYKPRYINHCGIKEIASFFLISPHKESYIIQKWKTEFVKRFASNSPNTGCHAINSIKNFTKDNFEYQTVFSVISQLYDADDQIRTTINSMAQIDEKHVHSFTPRGDDRYAKNFYCHTYKRPDKNLMQKYLSSLNHDRQAQ